jgi:RpiR family carbohydrate utilization transcriptional regulator
LLDRLDTLRERLTPAERKVAALVEGDPGRITRGTLATVAREAGVSEPTVIRFCRSLGLEGFSELRLALARAEGGAAPVTLRRISPATPAAEVPGAALDAAIASLSALRQGLDASALQNAARLLLGAARVEIWGTGPLAPVAEAIGWSLAGFCRNLVVRQDPRMQAAAAAGLEADAVVLCVTGGEAFHALAEAVASGARIIALAGAPTLPGPTLPGATLLIRGAVPPDAGLAAPLAARLALLALGEALALVVALLAPPEVRDRAARMEAAARG